MSRKQRSGSELEDLRGENRGLKKLIKSLQKQLARSNKEFRKLIANVEATAVDEPEPVIEPVIESIKCEKCNKKVQVSDLGKRMFYNCPACGHRKSRVKSG